MNGDEEIEQRYNPFVRLELRSTRDLKIPLVLDDWDFRFGFRCHPLEPTGDEGWYMYDSSAQYHTVWARRATIHIAEAKLGGARARVRARGEVLHHRAPVYGDEEYLEPTAYDTCSSDLVEFERMILDHADRMAER
jgi:hypothetical protein